MRARPVLSLSLMLLLLFTAVPASARPFTNLVVFGDSLSDTENLHRLTGGEQPPSPPYATARWSNGPLWPEYLAPALSAPLVNFAVAGAQTGRGNLAEEVYEVDFPGLLDQIDQFVALSPRADPRALYVVWAGADDLIPAPTPDTIGPAVKNLATAVGRLRELGALHIAVANMPDLGLTPMGLASGASAELTALSQGFNQALTAALAEAGLDVIVLDIFALSRHAARDPAEFGFTNLTSPCLDLATLTVCADPEGHGYWDDRHPTTAGHRVLADKFAKTINQAIRRSR